MGVKINPNDAQALLAKVSGKKPDKPKEKPMEEGPLKTNEQLEKEAREKIAKGLQARGEEAKDSKEKEPKMVVGDEEVSDEQDTTVKDGETAHADYDGRTKNSDVLDQLDAEAEPRPVSESQIEDEKRLSRLEAKEEIQMPPPPTGHEKPHAGEPEEEAEVLDEEENVLTQIFEKEEPGEITQIYLGEVEEEITQKGFAKAPVKNEDLLMVLKKIDEMIKGMKAENAELKEENEELKVKLSPETLKVLVAAVVLEEMKKVKLPEPDMEKIREMIEDSVQEKIEDEGFMGMLVYNVLHENRELLESAVVRTGVGAAPEKEERVDIPKPIKQVKEEYIKSGTDPKKAEIAANAMTDTIDALKLALEEGPDGEKYLDALEACEKKYGEEIVAIILKRLPEAELEAFMNKNLATLIRMRAEYVIEKYYSG